MNNEEKHITFQSLMDSAYEIYQQEGKTYENMLEESTVNERLAVLLGNLNYQVGNGGITQWVDNGYGLNIEEVIKALETIDTDTSKAVAKHLKGFIEDIELEQENRGWGCYWKEEECPDCDGNGWIENEESEESEDCDYCEGQGRINSACGAKCDNFDDSYYQVQDKLLDEIEAYFINNPDNKTIAA